MTGNGVAPMCTATGAGVGRGIGVGVGVNVGLSVAVWCGAEEGMSVYFTRDLI